MRSAVIFLVVAVISTSLSAADERFTGFWKEKCEDAFGLQIKPASNDLYSVSFCGPGGCFEPGTYRPNTRLEGDPSYQVVDNKHIKVRGLDGWSVYTKCTDETKPKLQYKGCAKREMTTASRTNSGGALCKS